MFQKPFKVKSNCRMKNSDRKKLKLDIMKDFPSLRSDELDVIFPTKANISNLKIIADNEVNVQIICKDNVPMFFVYNGRNFPTLFMLWESPFLLPYVTTHANVVSVLVRGADLMMPGVSSLPTSQIFNLSQYDMVYVNVTDNKAAVGVGEMCVSSNTSFQPRREGKCVKLLHVYCDELYKMGCRIALPSFGSVLEQYNPRSKPIKIPRQKIKKENSGILEEEDEVIYVPNIDDTVKVKCESEPGLSVQKTLDAVKIESKEATKNKDISKEGQTIKKENLSILEEEVSSIDTESSSILEEEEKVTYVSSTDTESSSILEEEDEVIYVPATDDTIAVKCETEQSLSVQKKIKAVNKDDHGVTKKKGNPATRKINVREEAKKNKNISKEGQKIKKENSSILEEEEEVTYVSSTDVENSSILEEEDDDVIYVPPTDDTIAVKCETEQSLSVQKKFKAVNKDDHGVTKKKGNPATRKINVTEKTKKNKIISKKEQKIKKKNSSSLQEEEEKITNDTIAVKCETKQSLPVQKVCDSVNKDDHGVIKKKGNPATRKIKVIEKEKKNKNISKGGQKVNKENSSSLQEEEITDVPATDDSVAEKCETEQCLPVQKICDSVNKHDPSVPKRKGNSATRKNKFEEAQKKDDISKGGQKIEKENSNMLRVGDKVTYGPAIDDNIAVRCVNELDSCFETSSDSFNEDNQLTEDVNMDRLLRYCFLKALKKMSVEQVKLPILISAFYKLHMIPSCPDGFILNVKKSSYKKISNLIQDMADQGIITSHKLRSGVQHLMSFNLSHKLLCDFTDTFGTITQEDLPGKCERKISETYSVTTTVLPVFSEFLLRKGEDLSPAEARKYISQYIQKKGLHPSNEPLVKLDEPLKSILYRGNNNGDTICSMKWEDVINGVLEKMGRSYTVENGEKSLMGKGFKGSPPIIEIRVAKRTGNKKVTLVDNVESYNIDMEEFAHECRKGAAASTTINHPKGSKGAQLQIQGNQVHYIGKLLLEKYLIPKKNLRGLELALKKKGK